MNEDFLDFLMALLAEKAEFLVVGAHALAVHGVLRATGDLDVWINPTASNADRVWKALVRFNAPVDDLGITRGDLQSSDSVIQLGLPPRRIDLLTAISGIGSFAEAWQEKTEIEMGMPSPVPVLGRLDLIRNKRATGRAKDLADIESLDRGE